MLAVCDRIAASGALDQLGRAEVAGAGGMTKRLDRGGGRLIAMVLAGQADRRDADTKDQGDKQQGHARSRALRLEGRATDDMTALGVAQQAQG